MDGIESAAATIERYAVYTAVEAAHRLRLLPEELDPFLVSRDLNPVTAGRLRLYPGELLLQAMGYQFAPASTREILAREVYSCEETAERLRISQRMVVSLIKAGKLRSVRLGRRVVVRGDDVLRYLESAVEDWSHARAKA